MTQELITEMVGYKIFNEDLTCRDFQFREGIINELGNNEPLELCENGFHFCIHPSGVWSYYSSGRVFKIRAYEVLYEYEPGAGLKCVSRKIELLEEIKVSETGNTGDRNTGDGNTGDGNTGDGNTGDGNTGDRNTGDRNTGDRSTGDRNTGYWNTGCWNTGYRNTGYRNTGDGNTGDGNTGDGNVGDKHAGQLNIKAEPLIIFDEVYTGEVTQTIRNNIKRLCKALYNDQPFDYALYIGIPNATEAKIKKLHKAHIEARKKIKEGK